MLLYKVSPENHCIARLDARHYYLRYLTNHGPGPIYSRTLSFQEAPMFTLTEAAKTQLDSYFADKEKSPIRVYLSSGG